MPAVKRHFCPRDGGQLFAEDDEAVCLQCGYRCDLASLASLDGSNGQSAGDPFAAVVAAVEAAVAALRNEMEKHRRESDRVAQQLSRVEAALIVLTEAGVVVKKRGTGFAQVRISQEGAKERKNGHWSPEQRAAASERMRETRRKQREAAAAREERR